MSTTTMEEEDKAMLEEERGRYLRAADAVQSGVSLALSLATELDADSIQRSLRFGVNSAMVEVTAVARLLMEKGIITEVEYMTALADAMEGEAHRQEVFLSRRFGRRIRLL